MPIPKPSYPAEFCRQMVELVQAGRSTSPLAREFDGSAQSISTWVARSAADSSKPARGKDVLTSVERDDLARLRRENRQLKHERDILANRLHGALSPGGIETPAHRLARRMAPRPLAFWRR